MNNTPDARPAGETAAEAETRSAFRFLDHAVLCLVRDARGLVPSRKRPDWELYRIALERYRDAVAAEARAALLAGAPVVWVATDRGARISHLSPGRWEMYDGIAFAYEDSESMPLWSHPPLTPPGTCVRYRLVPDPEETP